MTPFPKSSHIAQAKQRLRDRELVRAEAFEGLRRQAEADVSAIVHMIVDKYRPIRIYQWGSVLRPGGFRGYSDIDIAVEGITDPQAFFLMLGEAQALTHFPLDLVQIEKIAPEYAEDIRQKGKIVYERYGSDF
jgi:predicted nucleotidyltransferase